MIRSVRSALLATCLVLAGCATTPPASSYDVIVRNGTIYDGGGGAPFTGDVAIKGDKIVQVSPRVPGTAATEIDAKGLAVAPGFINMLSWATESLIEDGRGQSDIRQGVTLEVMGEGWSMGPLNPEMKRLLVERQDDLRFPVTWTSLGDYLQFLERKGVSPNVASFVGAATIRIHELGERDVDPTPAQLARMRMLVRQAMNEGAMGVAARSSTRPATSPRRTS
jgi:N-acyl-D-amino-acid deacylase